MGNRHPYILMFGQLKLQVRWIAFSKSLRMAIGLKSQCTAPHFSRTCFIQEILLSVVFLANKQKTSGM